MQATSEQTKIIQVVRDGHDCSVNAGPGTGKTTLIGMLGRDRPELSVLNCCFNRSTKLEADQKMPSWFKNMTFHGLAYAQVGKFMAKKLNIKINPRIVADRFGCDLHTATVAKYAVRRFATSEDGVIMGRHIPKESLAAKSQEDRALFQEDVVTVARKLWMAATNVKDKNIGCEHDFYLKQWVEEGAKLNGRFDVVMVDEAQDMVPVNTKALRRMYGQKVKVGDINQTLYEWRGVSDFEGDHHLTYSHRFGEAIASVANDVLVMIDSQQPKLKGVSSYPSEIKQGEPDGRHVILCRSNAGLLGEALFAIRKGKSIHVIGNLVESILLMESAWYLSIGEKHKVKHPTLQLFEDWNGVMEVAKEDADLRIAVKRVEEYGGQIPYLCEEVRSVGETSAERADVVLSTVHKFKGMEAPVVKLGEDFPDLVRFDRKERRYKPMKGELCVFFVAVTRAMQKLYVNSTAAQLKTWKELLD